MAADPLVARILVVDDDEATRILFAQVLAREGFDTVSVADGTAALASVAEGDVDLVLLDCQMPGLSGRDVVATIRDDPRSRLLPVIMVTGEVTSHDRIHGLDAGADDYLTKPVDIGELAARVRARLRGRSAWIAAVDDLLAHAEPGDRFATRAASVRALIDDRAFDTFLQPIVELGSGRVVGQEALTRWHDGTAPWNRFAEAHELGLGVELELATASAALLAAEALAPGQWLSVNASAEALADPCFAELLATEGRSLVVEITEHRPVADYDALRRDLARLGPAIRVAVDDAGAGYASLQHILELSPHLVKLDISWVQSLCRDRARQVLVSSLQHFASETGTSLVAEGIEDEDTRALLRAMGVRYGQGYLFGRPAPAPAPVPPVAPLLPTA